MSKNNKRRKPQDFRPASAQADVQPSLKDTIHFEGHSYQVDFDAINDIEVLEAFQRPAGFFSAELNGTMTALQKALGIEEYEKFKADQAKMHGRCSATALFELFNLVNNGAGGNFEASSNSSVDEAKPSKPTSSGTTD